MVGGERHHRRGGHAGPRLSRKPATPHTPKLYFREPLPRALRRETRLRDTRAHCPLVGEKHGKLREKPQHPPFRVSKASYG